MIVCGHGERLPAGPSARGRPFVGWEERACEGGASIDELSQTFRAENVGNQTQSRCLASRVVVGGAHLLTINAALWADLKCKIAGLSTSGERGLYIPCKLSCKRLPKSHVILSLSGIGPVEKKEILVRMGLGWNLPLWHGGEWDTPPHPQTPSNPSRRQWAKVRKHLFELLSQIQIQVLCCYSSTSCYCWCHTCFIADLVFLVMVAAWLLLLSSQWFALDVADLCPCLPARETWKHWHEQGQERHDHRSNSRTAKSRHPDFSTQVPDHSHPAPRDSLTRVASPQRTSVKTFQRQHPMHSHPLHVWSGLMPAHASCSSHIVIRCFSEELTKIEELIKREIIHMTWQWSTHQHEEKELSR